MSSVAENQNLLPLPPSQQGTDYDTFRDNYGGLTAVRIQTGEDHTEQETLSDPATELGQDGHNQTQNKPENYKHGQQRRQRTRLPFCLSSLKPLKCLAIAFGLWSELGRWSLFLMIPAALSILPAEMYLTEVVFHCTVRCNEGPYGSIGDTSPTTSTITAITSTVNPDSYETTIQRINLDVIVILLIQIPSYLSMVYCIRHLSKYPQVLRLPQAFKLAKKTKSVNIILLMSVTMIVASMVIKSDIQEMLESVDTNIYISTYLCQYLPFENKKSFFAWRLFSSIIAWQAVISCLVFGVVMKALAALVDQCLDRTITMQADSVDRYIQVHQEFCCKIESTLAAFKKWLIINTFGYIVLVIWVFGRLISYIANRTYIFVLGSLPTSCDIPFLLVDYYYFLTLFLYASFICYYPWYSIASLKRSFDRFVLKLNDKTDWSPQHPFKNRLHLNSFLQYAKITEYRPFMRFTCNAIMPYLSILLAVCGLSLALLKYAKDYYHNPYEPEESMPWNGLNTPLPPTP